MSLLPNLDEMTDNEKMAVLESIQKSIAQSKEIQKQKIAANVDLVIQALKKIESDIRSRFDDVGNAIEKRVSNIKDGRDGSNGKDGRDGKDGRNGKDGAKGDRGERGQDGRDGINGIDGVSVSNARIDFDGSLIITLSSGIEINVGEVVAPDLAESIKVITNGGGTSQYVLDTLTSLQTQITNLIPSQTGNSGKYLTTNGTALSWATIAGSLSYLGTWNASTNSPTLTSSVGTNGNYYIVATAGSTNLNGITDWKVGDWLLFNGSVWQKIDQSETLQSITSTDGSVTVTTTGSTADLSVAVAASTTNVVCYVRNTTGATLTKGTAVYINGATSQNPTVTKAQANNDANSAQTLGLMSADLANNSNGYVTIIGLITNINTSAYTDGEQLYLSPTTAGALTATKSYAPNHLVYVAIVEHAHPTQGKLFVKVQNGYELDELHNVSAQSPSNGQTIIYNATTSLWEKGNLTSGTGISVSNGAGSITVSNTGVTSVTGTSPVASSGGATPAISLASGYGDTQNPFASKTANFVLAAPNGSSGAPTFRAIVAADIPTLNQNTTGSAATVTTTINSGVVATTQTAGDNSTKVATTAYVNAITGTSGINGFKNRLINSAMVIDQRNAGASVTIPSAAVTYTLDRWFAYATQASKFTIQQNAGSVTPPSGFSNYLGCTVGASANVTVGATDTFTVRQYIEGFNTADLAWGTASAATVTLSFWVRSSLTGTFGGAVGNAAGNRNYPFTYTISAANTWEQKSITIAGDITGTWATNNTAGISLFLNLGTGSTYSTTAGAWASGTYVSATGATNWISTNSATWYITGVQLEKGSTATSFDYRPYGTELSLCQRYYHKFVQGSFSGFVGISSYYIPWKVSMRVAPTPTTSGGTATNVSSQTWNEIDVNGSRYSMTVSSLNGGYYNQTVELLGAEL